MGDSYITWGILIYLMGDFHMIWVILVWGLGMRLIVGRINERFLVRMLNLCSRGSL